MTEKKVGTTLKQFFDKLNSLGKKADTNFLFYPKPIIYMSETEFPCVTYSISNRAPWEEFSGHKPRWKDAETNMNKKDRKTVTYSQMFETSVEFSVWSRSYKKVNEYREWFEQFMIRHTKDFKKMGMLEVVFSEQKTDSLETVNENEFIVQPLIYYVRNERIDKFVLDSIDDINTKSKRLSLQQDIANKLNN